MSDQQRLTLAAALVNELADDPAELERLRALLDTATVERRIDIKEAADLLHCSAGWLARAAKAGRVIGAEKVGQRWTFIASKLKVLPVQAVSDITPEGAGRGTRSLGDSATTAAIRNAGARRAA